jgi:PAS domain-containing protein
MSKSWKEPQRWTWEAFPDRASAELQCRAGARAFDKMSRSHNPIQVMIDAIPAMAWCSLPDGSVEFLNQRWRDYTGLSPYESHG